MDWVHCNNCFRLPDSEKAFFLTSCGHIYCSNCEGQCTRPQCKLCSNQCSTIPISATMKPDVKIYFTDTDELLKKKLKEVQQVSEFQKNQRARLMAYQRKQLKKFQSVKGDFQKLIQKLKDIDSERNRLCQENDVLKKFIGMQRSQTHGEHANTTHKAHPKHYDGTSPSNLNTVLSKFINKFDNPQSCSNKAQRMCVISPPINGKLGVIPGTPSPSSTMSKLNLSAHYSNESLHKRSSQFETPGISPASMRCSLSTFVTPKTPNTISPLGNFLSPNDLENAMQYKKDYRRKVVVHPFSPND